MDIINLSKDSDTQQFSMNDNINNRPSNINIVKDYVAPNVSEKVVRTILSYTDYINRFVWKKFD